MRSALKEPHSMAFAPERSEDPMPQLYLGVDYRRDPLFFRVPSPRGPERPVAEASQPNPLSTVNEKSVLKLGATEDSADAAGLDELSFQAENSPDDGTKGHKKQCDQRRDTRDVKAAPQRLPPPDAQTHLPRMNRSARIRQEHISRAMAPEMTGDSAVAARGPGGPGGPGRGVRQPRGPSASPSVTPRGTRSAILRSTCARQRMDAATAAAAEEKSPRAAPTMGKKKGREPVRADLNWKSLSTFIQKTAHDGLVTSPRVHRTGPASKRIVPLSAVNRNTSHEIATKRWATAPPPPSSARMRQRPASVPANESSRVAADSLKMVFENRSPSPKITASIDHSLRNQSGAATEHIAQREQFEHSSDVESIVSESKPAVRLFATEESSAAVLWLDNIPAVITTTSVKSPVPSTETSPKPQEDIKESLLNLPSSLLGTEAEVQIPLNAAQPHPGIVVDCLSSLETISVVDFSDESNVTPRSRRSDSCGEHERSPPPVYCRNETLPMVERCASAAAVSEVSAEDDMPVTSPLSRSLLERRMQSVPRYLLVRAAAAAAAAAAVSVRSSRTMTCSTLRRYLALRQRLRLAKLRASYTAWLQWRTRLLAMGCTRSSTSPERPSPAPLSLRAIQKAVDTYSDSDSSSFCSSSPPQQGMPAENERVSLMQLPPLCPPKPRDEENVFDHFFAEESAERTAPPRPKTPVNCASHEENSLRSRVSSASRHSSAAPSVLDGEEETALVGVLPTVEPSTPPHKIQCVHYEL